MIGIAAKLTRAGVGDYWDDIDRWARNQFAENQLTEGEWIYRLAESMPKKPVAFNETAEHVVKRNMGGFAGWASGNEWALTTALCIAVPETPPVLFTTFGRTSWSRKREVPSESTAQSCFILGRCAQFHSAPRQG